MPKLQNVRDDMLEPPKLIAKVNRVLNARLSCGSSKSAFRSTSHSSESFLQLRIKKAHICLFMSALEKVLLDGTSGGFSVDMYISSLF